MIFVTVGHEMGFDRLIEAVDQFAASHPDLNFFAQVGTLDEESYKPKFIDFQEFVSPEEFSSRIAKATLIIAHAGMGSIITALSQEKPLLIMPRRGHLRETRNDHQVATAEQFSKRDGIYVAENESVFADVLAETLRSVSLRSVRKASPFASEDLLSAIHNFIWEK